MSRSPCPHLDPFGRNGTHAFCAATGHHVYHKPGLRCLCDFCTPGPGDKHVIDKNVVFLADDTIDLKSAQAPAPARKPGLLGFV